MAGMALRRCGSGARAFLCGAYSRSLPTHNSISNGPCGSPSYGIVRSLFSSSLRVPNGVLGINAILPVVPGLALTLQFGSAKATVFRNMSTSAASKSGSKGCTSNPGGSGGQQPKSETRIAAILRSMQDKMKMEDLPAAALGLGLAGALPFVILTPPFSSVLPLPEALCRQPLEAQAAYGAVILSFLGGPHWGLGMVRTHAPPHDKVFNIDISTFRFVWSVIPSLLAWSALLLSDTPKMSILIFSFALVSKIDLSKKEVNVAWKKDAKPGTKPKDDKALGVDAWCSLEGLLPPWYLPLRVLLSLVVILCLISSTLYTYFNYKEKSGTEMLEG